MKKAIGIPVDTKRMKVNIDVEPSTPFEIPDVDLLKQLANEPLRKLIKKLWSLFLIYGNNLNYVLPYLNSVFAVMVVSSVIKALSMWNKRNGTKIVKLFKKKK